MNKNKQFNVDLKPFVSVIMPVRNEAAFIENSLTALLRQTYPADRMEIIVADGMSFDNTQEIVERINNDSEIPILLVANPRMIAPAGLNCALKKASGQIIVRVDGHCEVEPDYVANCVVLLQSGEAEGVGGPIETVGSTVRAEAIAKAMSSTFGVGGSAFRTIDDRRMYVDSVAFPGYTRKIIEEAGSFNEELVRNQDDEYNYRIRKLGGRILLSPTIRSRYYSRSTFRSLWRQYYQYGYWKVRVLQLHPRQMSVRQFVPFIFVMAIILTALAGIFSNVGKWSFLLIIASYLLTNFIASIWTAKSKVILLPQLMVSFSILHLSYGAGFLIGLISFRKRWGKKQVCIHPSPQS